MSERKSKELPHKPPAKRRRDRAYDVGVPPSFEVAEPAPAAYDLGGSPEIGVVVSLLAERLAAFERAGGSVRRLGGAEAVAERMLAALPASSAWNEALGPFYTTPQVARLLGDISRQAVASRRSSHSLVALRTADDQWVYPAFQFDPRHGTLPGLADLWAVLVGSEEERWTLARWLVAEQDELGGRSVVEALRSGVSTKELLPLVRDAARRFAH